MASRRAIGVLLIALSAVCFAAMPVFARVVYGSGGDPGTLLALRFSGAAIILLVLAFGRRAVMPSGRALIGLLLMGGCFISLGLFISSLTKNQIVAGMVTFAVFLLLWVITWIGSAAGPQAEKITQYLSIVGHLDDFGKGVLDTTHLIYYLSFITFGLFLTAKSVDTERWRG